MSNYAKKELAQRRKDLKQELDYLLKQNENGVRPKDRLIMFFFLLPMALFAFNFALDYFSQGKYVLAGLIILAAIVICTMLLSGKNYKRRQTRIAEIRYELKELGVDPDGLDD